MSRCQLLPFLNANERHHTHYTHGRGYGKPYRMGWDILRLSPFAHRLLHFPWGRVRTQNAAAKAIARWFPRRVQPAVESLLRFPNPIQRALHWIARLHWVLGRLP